MSEGSQAERLSIQWTPISQTQLRSIDRQTALEILHCIDRYLAQRQGDVKKLTPPMMGYRLRCGNYRILFDYDEGVKHIHINAVKHRKDAYRLS